MRRLASARKTTTHVLIRHSQSFRGKIIRSVFLASCLLAFTWTAASQNREKQAGAYDPAPWLGDFRQLLSEMSSHYANLEWAIEDRHMDLPRLRRQTEKKLREAKDDSEARHILSQFVDGFGDGHLEIRWPKTQGPSSVSPDAEKQSLCERLGYQAHTSPGLDFSLLPGFTPLANDDSGLFPGGWLRLAHGKVVGIVRIGLFSERAHPEVCRQAVRKLGVAETSDCDEDCGNRIERETADLLTAALVRQEGVLRQAGATVLVVDITHNGGGSNWVEAPPRALSPIPLRDLAFAFIRHEHWTNQLEERLHDVQTDIGRGAAPRAVLQQAAAKLQQAIRESRQPCDRTEVWETGKVNCSLLVKGLLYTSGELPYAKPGSFASLESRTTLFDPLRYAYTENPNRLPLLVVVDRETWSAAEYFAALLQSNRAATIVGELTGGAGCGYTNGGIPTKLKSSGAEIKMPDCVRFQADGSNEVNGITPDILVPWAERDSQYQRVKKLEAALKQVRVNP
jgi:hypothetical protein